MFGIVFGLSDAILGLTFLAWGNSIGGESSSVLISFGKSRSKRTDQVRPNIMI